ncbi:hypothetical protein SpCBS45565_g06798 [Spizellomyces sp. 'palustris']|nr:hypothetical protein SpCBS45565_g06798 [Spizellomyces sp. 'palustris']
MGHEAEAVSTANPDTKSPMKQLRHSSAPTKHTRATSPPVRAASTKPTRPLPEVRSPSPLPPSTLPPPTPATEHRRYSPVYKCSNRLLAKRWDDAARKRHREKLASMKPAVDNSPPKKYSHLDMRLKKIRQEQEQSQRVQQENIILLNRMARQMSAPQGFSNIDSHYRVKETLKKPHPGARKRQEELKHVDEANIIYVQRIEDRQPHYSRATWNEERRKNLLYLANHSRFPEIYVDVCEREGVQLPFVKRSRPGSARSPVTHPSDEQVCGAAVITVKNEETKNSREESEAGQGWETEDEDGEKQTTDQNNGGVTAD